MTEKIEQVAARLGITPAELEQVTTGRNATLVEFEQIAADHGITPAEFTRRFLYGRGALRPGRRAGIAALDLPPGYDPGSHELRLPEKGAMRSDESDVTLWVKPGQKGRPAVIGPLQRAVQAEEKRRFDEIGNSLNAQSTRRAAKAAAEVHKAKGAETAAKVEALAAEGKRPNVIAKRVGLNEKSGARRVNQILAAAKNKKSP